MSVQECKVLCREMVGEPLPKRFPIASENMDRGGRWLIASTGDD